MYGRSLISENPVRFHNVIPFHIRTIVDRIGINYRHHANDVRREKGRDLHENDEVLERLFPYQFCHWCSDRNFAGISIWHELVSILPVRRGCFRGSFGN